MVLMDAVISVTQNVARVLSPKIKNMVQKFCLFLIDAKHTSDKLAAKLIVSITWRRMIMMIMVRRMGQYLLMAMPFISAWVSLWKCSWLTYIPQGNSKNASVYACYQSTSTYQDTEHHYPPYNSA